LVFAPLGTKKSLIRMPDPMILPSIAGRLGMTDVYVC